MYGDPTAAMPFVMSGRFRVDIFFVISGCVMALAIDKLPDTSEAPAIFLRRRLERIVPPYWIVTGLLAVLLLLAPTLFQTLRFDIDHLIRSLFFLPQAQLPLLQIGWTLNFEIYFYLLLAFVLTTTPRRWLIPAATILLITPVLVLSLNEHTNPTAVFLGSPFMLEFLSGLWLGHAIARGATAPTVAAYFAIALAVSGFAWSQGYAPQGMNRMLWWGVPAFLLVGGLVMLEGKLPIPRVLIALGASSYSLYLTHTFVVIGAGVLLKSLGGTGIMHNMAIVILGVGASLVTGEFFHRYVERPLMQRSQRKKTKPLSAD